MLNRKEKYNQLYSVWIDHEEDYPEEIKKLRSSLGKIGLKPNGCDAWLTNFTLQNEEEE